MPIEDGTPVPNLTMIGVAKYMASAQAIQRENLLYHYKFPKPEGSAQADYYTWAKDSIRAYHEAGNDITVLDTAILDIERTMLGANQQAAAKLDNNRRVLQSYRSYFALKKLVPQPHQPVEILFEGVRIKLRPHLIATEGKRTRIIQYAYGRDGATKEELHFLKQLLLFYGQKAGIEVSNSDCLLMEIATGDIHNPSGVASTFEAKLRHAMREAKRTWAYLELK